MVFVGVFDSIIYKDITGIQKSDDGYIKEIYSLNDNPSFEIRFDSLDFFGSFFHQGKNE